LIVIAIAGQNEINCFKRAIAFLLWGGIALLVKGVIVFWEVGQKAIAVRHKMLVSMTTRNIIPAGIADAQL